MEIQKIEDTPKLYIKVQEKPKKIKKVNDHKEPKIKIIKEPKIKNPIKHNIVSLNNPKLYKENKNEYFRQVMLSRSKCYINCECGGKYSLAKKKRHYKTKKHTNNIKLY